METIFAQSSAFGKAGVAVFRISGTKSLEVLEILTGKKDFKPRLMYYQKIISPESGDLIDNAMIVYFKTPHNFTGEDVAEIHTHGSKAISVMLTNALLNIPNVRLAEAGEFTKRAFLNNKFDLTAAEGIADLINAETIMQHKQAIRQASGGLEELYNNWRSQLLRVISLLEAYIDFPDEDIPNSVLNEVLGTHRKLVNEISEYLNDNRKGELLRSGLKLAIIGPPNAGKSSLLNFLMRRDIAIVSNIAGTTRDIIEGHLDIGGYPIILQDTAGIRGKSSDVIVNSVKLGYKKRGAKPINNRRATSDDVGEFKSIDYIEEEGIKRAIYSAKKADIKIVMFDAEKLDSSISEDITDLIDENTIIVINKIDLIPENKIFDIERCIVNSVNLGYKESRVEPIRIGETTSHDVGEFKSIDYKCLKVSVKDNIALSSILKNIEQIAENMAGFTETPYITNERHRHHLKQALIYLKDFNLDNDLVLATEDIRMTARCIGAITGVIGVEEILGEIFKNFCIGK